MNLHKIFNTEPTNAVEYPAESGIYHIPIISVKEMLWEDFSSWLTSDFRFSVYNDKNGLIISGSVELTLVYKHKKEDGTDEYFSYRINGAYSSSAEMYAPNKNYEAIVLAECIKNASKNIGRKYGFYLNDGRTEMPKTETVKEAIPTMDISNFNNKKTKKQDA